MLFRSVLAEFVGTLTLVATVVGSGVMAVRLSGGNEGVALLANALATGAVLVALVTALAPVSGAHFNPAVTVVAFATRSLGVAPAGAYVGAQVVGGLLGTLLAHAMFELPLLQSSAHARAGPAQWLSEAIATGLLLLVITLVARRAPERVPLAVACTIVAAYWFTASTSFANPAVTIARAFTDTFAGIRPADVPAFCLAQLVGALLGTGLARRLDPPEVS